MECSTASQRTHLCLFPLLAVINLFQNTLPTDDLLSGAIRKVVFVPRVTKERLSKEKAAEVGENVFVPVDNELCEEEGLGAKPFGNKALASANHSA